jgi:hypothetical protein
MSEFCRPRAMTEFCGPRAMTELCRPRAMIELCRPRVMTELCRPRATRLRGAAAGLVLGCTLCGALGGCASPQPSGAAQEAAGTRAAPGAVPASEIPAGAIRVGQELYQVPIGRDADGCAIYRLYSPTRLVSQAISYRSRDGGFTIDRQKADCPSG